MDTSGGIQMKLFVRLVFSTLVFLIVTACSQGDQEQISEPKDVPPEIIQNNEGEEQHESEENKDDFDLNEEVDENLNQEKSIEPEYKITDSWSIQPISDDRNKQVVLLTIDDAPEHYAVDMARTLKELDAPAIFFVNGHFLESEEDQQKLKDIHDMGFAIGNHTYSHANLRDLSEDDQREEIVRVNDMVEEITGEAPLFFRSPYGVNTDYASDLVEELGMTLMNWTYGYDWEPDYRTKETIAHIMVHADELGNGANLLMHDREWTAEALKEIVSGLRDKGYDFVDPHLIERPEEIVK